MNLQHNHSSSKMTGHDAGCSPLLIHHQRLTTPTERSFPERFQTFHLRHNERRQDSPGHSIRPRPFNPHSTNDCIKYPLIAFKTPPADNPSSSRSMLK
mmetsp:Transcript_46302/g.56113  ORF Transcript_46302/g.56113 Transcript_46302/m.56113 type:complete len:98 (-) Transcript_46302:112-405(-)